MSFNMSKKESNWSDEVSLFLKAQCRHMEEYCDAQTGLRNALLLDTNSRAHPKDLKKCMLDLSDAMHEIQNDLRKLSAFELSATKKQSAALETHASRSLRVLETIGRSLFHPNGLIISDGKDDVHRKTVAISTMRASIAQFEHALAVS